MQKPLKQTAKSLQKSHIEYGNTAQVPDAFKVGDSVYFFDPILLSNEPKTFKEHWTELFQIVHRVNPQLYKILDHSNLNASLNAGNTKSIYASRLKLRY
jgi:hypothetical protein